MVMTMVEVYLEQPPILRRVLAGGLQYSYSHERAVF